MVAKCVSDAGVEKSFVIFLRFSWGGHKKNIILGKFTSLKFIRNGSDHPDLSRFSFSSPADNPGETHPSKGRPFSPQFSTIFNPFS